MISRLAFIDTERCCVIMICARVFFSRRVMSGQFRRRLPFLDPSRRLSPFAGDWAAHRLAAGQGDARMDSVPSLMNTDRMELPLVGLLWAIFFYETDRFSSAGCKTPYRIVDVLGRPLIDGAFRGRDARKEGRPSRFAREAKQSAGSTAVFF